MSCASMEKVRERKRKSYEKRGRGIKKKKEESCGGQSLDRSIGLSLHLLLNFQHWG